MNAIANRARELATNCEAKKHGYRQTQDGVVVSFVLHPQQVPETLAIAPLGTRYVLALVEVDDNEEPKGGEAAEQRHVDTAPRSPTPAGGAHKSWDELSPQQQAGILCNEPPFYSYIYNNCCHPSIHQSVDDASTMQEAAAIIVREYCGVGSRKDIRRGHVSGVHWDDLVSRYRAWQREPEYVDA